ncbi:MAG: MFS transporter, partial [Deltaproteobacteria bacterium]|nr:MFS transporter [Deltaproteobacteria bacterium]
MTQELMGDFGISAAALGNLSAFYFYGYVAMQVPTGLLADAWGPRRLLTAGALGAALGAVIFALAQDLWWASLGRLLIGSSVAVAFVVLLKLNVHWFPARRFAMLSGLAVLFGVLGAVTAGEPLRRLIDAFGWRPVTLASGLLTLGIAAVTWLHVRDDPAARGFASFAPSAQPGRPRAAQAPRVGVWTGLGRIFRHRNLWILSLAPGGMTGPVLAFAGLWGVPFLQARFGLSREEGARMCSLLMVTWAVAGPLLGLWSERLGRRKPLYLGGAVVACLGWVALIYLPGLPLWLFAVVLGLVGAANGGMIIGFAFAKESAPPSLAGTVSGAVNMGVMLGATLLQPGIGWVLDRHWTGGLVDGIRVYELAAFQAGFSLMLGWAVLACLLL